MNNLDINSIDTKAIDSYLTSLISKSLNKVEVMDIILTGKQPDYQVMIKDLYVIS